MMAGVDGTVVAGDVGSTIKRACVEFKESEVKFEKAKVVEYSAVVVNTDSGSVGLRDDRKLVLGSSRAHSHL